MKRKRIVIAVFVYALCVIAAGSGAEDQPIQRGINFIAVMDLKCGEGVKPSLAGPLADVVTDELLKIKKYSVLDRPNRDKSLREAGFQMAGCADESCAIQAGKLLGVGKLIIGSVTYIDGTYLITLQLINIESAVVEASTRETCKCDFEKLINALANVTRRLVGEPPQAPVSATQNPLRPPPPPAEIPPPPDEIKFIGATAEQNKLCPQGMIYIPAGSFMMGCNQAKSLSCQPNEYPYHAVYLDAFCIDKYEYPNAVGKVAKNNVTWAEAQKTCNSIGKKLPTEAEWEKAARGTDGRTFPWGYEMDKDRRKMLRLLYQAGTYSWNVSPYGAYDMIGSVWEWTADWYDEHYYQNSPKRNPTGPSSGKYRVSRGGGQGYGGTIVWIEKVSFRGQLSPDFSYPYLGFRCVKNP